MPKHVSVTEAHAQLAQGSVYVDVRSQGEYAQGHPAGAVNIPLIDRDPRSGQMMPNPDFMQVMQGNYPVDTKLLIGCQVGGRSMRAAQMLEAFGFSDVSNVKGGFSGMRDYTGRSVDPGWEEEGLPIETDAPAGQGYEDLVTKAGL